MVVQNINNINLNEKNIQAPFQYLIGEDDFELLEYTDDFLLTEDNPRLKYREDQKYFIVDLGASIDGDINETNILIDNTKIYPIRVGAIEELRDAIINENNFAVVANDNNFKSVIILPKININKRLKYTIYTYATSISSYMFDEVARKLNTLDINYPVKNFYQNESYKINDIIKYNGYLYRVLKDFNNTENDDRLLMSNTMIITPFKRLENKDYKLYDILEINNKYFIVQKPFTYADNNALENNLSPLINIIDWYDTIEQLYKNTILIKDGKKYLVINDTRMPVWEEVYKTSVIDFIRASEIPADNNETIQEAINRIDNEIEKVTNDITEDYNNLQQNIDNEAYIREQNDNEIKLVKQDKIQNGIDNIIHNKTYNVIDTDLNIDKKNPIIMDSDTIDITINTNGNITVNLEASNLEYELNKNILTIKKINKEEGTDYSGTLTITVNKDACLENIYREKSITLYINSNTLYTDLSVDNDVLNIEPNSNIDLVLNTNAETIEYYIDNSNYEITKNDKTLNIKNISETEKTGAILIIQATAASTEDTTYVPTIIQIYINRTKDEVKELLTLDIISSIEASNNSILKRDEEGASNINMPSNIENTTIVNNEYLEKQLQSGLSKKQDKLIAGTNVEITENNVINVKADVVYAEASQVTQTNEALGINVQTALDILNSRYMIPCYYEQLTDDNGNFLEEEEPANWYQALYGVTTVWELVHNTKSIVYRTEGAKASVGRVNGLQPYGIKSLNGQITSRNGYAPVAAFLGGSGVFSVQENYQYGPEGRIVTGGGYFYVNMNTNKQIKEYPDDLVMDNLLVRKWKLVSINGISIKDILNEIKTKQKLLNDILNSQNIKRKGA